MTFSRWAAAMLVVTAAVFRGWLFALDFSKDLIGFEWVYTAIGWIGKLVVPALMVITMCIGVAGAQPPKWQDRLIVVVAAALCAIILFFPA